MSSLASSRVPATLHVNSSGLSKVTRRVYFMVLAVCQLAFSTDFNKFYSLAHKETFVI